MGGAHDRLTSFLSCHNKLPRYTMARRRDISGGFRNNHQLQQFQLSDVSPTGRVLGTGSFGSVEEVRPDLGS